MPIINFSVEKCIPMVEKGKPRWKRQTIRKKRKRLFKEGDIVYLYTGLRTKKCRKLGETFCTGVQTIKMYLNRSEPLILRWTGEDWNQLGKKESKTLAFDDGFKSTEEMWTWFQKTHGKEEQEFQVIEWGELL